MFQNTVDDNKTNAPVGYPGDCLESISLSAPVINVFQQCLPIASENYVKPCTSYTQLESVNESATFKVLLVVRFFF